LLGAIVLASMLVPAIASSTDISVPEPIPPTVYEIELTYLEGHENPAVALNGPPEAGPPVPYRPFEPILDLLPTMKTSRPFGPCEGSVDQEGDRITVLLAHGEGMPCGRRFLLQRDRKNLDALSYQSLHIRGRTNGRIRIGLEDHAAERREDHVALATVTGDFDLSIPLREPGRLMDLRQLTALVLLSEDKQARVVLDQVDFVQAGTAPTKPPAMGFWVWDYRKTIVDPEAVFSACHREACTRILVQMPAPTDPEPVWASYAAMFTLARRRGIEAVALDGYPEAIQEPQVLADKILRLLALVDAASLAGVQLDIEPYLLPGFFADQSGPERYLAAIDRLRAAVGGRTRLSMVIPFWFTSKMFGGRPLAYAVMERVDEVAVMSYRTDTDELQAIAEETLRYGDLIGTPVWLAVETTALPVERRVILRREPRAELADALLDYDGRRLIFGSVSRSAANGSRREGFRVYHRVTVRPELVTYFGRSRKEVSSSVKQITARTAHRSFAGVLVHDLNGFLALPEP
jgi:hypothetical protein